MEPALSIWPLSEELAPSFSIVDKNSPKGFLLYKGGMSGANLFISDFRISHYKASNPSDTKLGRESMDSMQKDTLTQAVLILEFGVIVVLVWGVSLEYRANQYLQAWLNEH